MAHEIEGNSVAWRGQAPWHKLGTQILPGDSLGTIILKAGLDWEVLSCSIMAAFDGSFRPLPNDRAIMRSTDGKRFMMASDEYIPLQNREIIEFYRQFCDAGQMEMEVCGALKKGSVVWALAKTADAFTLAGGDKSKTYLLLVNSHDGSMAFQAYFTSVRVVCNNTLRMSTSDRKRGSVYYMRHTRKFDSNAQAEAKRVLGIAHESSREFELIAAQLAENLRRYGYRVHHDLSANATGTVRRSAG